MTAPLPDDAPVPACPCCARPNDDRTWRVCDRDQQAVDQWLTEIQMLHEQIAATPLDYLLPASTGNDAPLGGHREPPLPLDLAALDLLTAESVLRGMDADDMGLEDWAVDWRHWLGHAGHGQATERDTGAAQTLAGVIRYLRANWPLMARSVADGGHPAVDEFHADVRAIRGRAWGALRLIPSDLDMDLDPPPDWVILCPRDLDNGSICGHRIGVMRQPRAVDGERPQAVTLNCERCGAHWDLPRLMLVAQASGTPVWVDAEAAATHLGTTVRGLAPMVRSGRISKRGSRYSVTRHADRQEA
jgi:hypothetical protein